MTLDRALGHEELRGDLAVFQAKHDESQDLLLAHRQGGLHESAAKRAGDNDLAEADRPDCETKALVELRLEHDAVCAVRESHPNLVAITARDHGDNRAIARALTHPPQGVGVSGRD